VAQQEDELHSMSCWFICGLLSDALCRIKKEKTLGTGESLLQCACVSSVGKYFLLYLNISMMGKWFSC
jgi:hypothetical protein